MGYAAEAVNGVIKAYDVRGLVGEQITPDFVAAVGAAFAVLMRNEGATRVAIGHDMRESSPALAAAFAHGVQAQGLDTVAIHLCSTDQLYYASGTFEAPGAMFTASHNPAAYNGIKLCRAGAKPVGQDTGLREISSLLVDGIPEFTGAVGTASDAETLPGYAAYLRGLVSLEGIRPLRVAVDAGNGMGGHTVPEVLGEVPGIEILPLYFELDGNFPNHEANPLEPANLVDLQEYVRSTHADVGIAFDGDADRCFIVDERGEPVAPSAITALIAQRVLAAEPGAVIIHNLITSRSVPELVADLGGSAVRTRVGHSFIKAQMAATGAAFGGEHSAHYYFRDFWGADSGMLAALYVLDALGSQDRPLSQLMAQYQRYSASGEINSKLASAEAQAERTEAVVAAFADRTTSVDRLDGVTVSLTGGAWFNVRASNTEPLLRLNAEAPTDAEIKSLTQEILAIIRA